MRIALLGDLHGRTHVLERALSRASDDGCELLVQLGDFGIWSGQSGDQFRRTVEWALAKQELPLYVVPGNHDNYNIIDNLDPDGGGWLPWIPDRCWLAPRGQTWTWGGRTFGAMGGAVSIDRYSRVEDITWWRHEAITQPEADAMAANAGPLDVLLVHDTPQGAHEEYTSDALWRGMIPPQLLGESRANRERLRQIVDACQPQTVVGGHWHQLLDSEITLATGQSTRVVNLHCDGEPGCYAVLDTESLELNISDERLTAPPRWRP